MAYYIRNDGALRSTDNGHQQSASRENTSRKAHAIRTKLTSLRQPCKLSDRRTKNVRRSTDWVRSGCALKYDLDADSTRLFRYLHHGWWKASLSVGAILTSTGWVRLVNISLIFIDESFFFSLLLPLLRIYYIRSLL